MKRLLKEQDRISQDSTKETNDAKAKLVPVQFKRQNDDSTEESKREMRILKRKLLDIKNEKFFIYHILRV